MGTWKENFIIIVSSIFEICDLCFKNPGNRILNQKLLKYAINTMSIKKLMEQCNSSSFIVISTVLPHVIFISFSIISKIEIFYVNEAKLFTEHLIKPICISTTLSSSNPN